MGGGAIQNQPHVSPATRHYSHPPSELHIIIHLALIFISIKSALENLFLVKCWWNISKFRYHRNFAEWCKILMFSQSVLYAVCNEVKMRLHFVICQ